jgi:hypothetical protein
MTGKLRPKEYKICFYILVVAVKKARGRRVRSLFKDKKEKI